MTFEVRQRGILPKQRSARETRTFTTEAEYNHLFMDDHNNSFTSPVFVGGVLNTRVTQDVDLVTLRFNYRFGGYSAPVAARY